MAKIETLEFIIEGKEFKSNVNVNKAGIFTLELNWQVVEALGLGREFSGKLQANTLKDLTSVIQNNYIEYKNSKTVHEILIGMGFRSSGWYHKDKDYTPSFSHGASSIQFDFELYHRKTLSTGAVILNKCAKVDTADQWGTIEFEGELFADGGVYYGSKKFIPYSLKAYETLEKAQTGLQSIATILYEFIIKDPDEMVKLLAGGNILKAKNGDGKN